VSSKHISGSKLLAFHSRSFETSVVLARILSNSRGGSVVGLDENPSGLGVKAEGILDGRQVTSQVAFFFALIAGRRPAQNTLRNETKRNDSVELSRFFCFG